MRSLLSLSLAVFLISACTSEKELDREQALIIINKQKVYPKTVEEEIYIADPEEAKKVLGSGLEQEGFVIVKKTQSLSEVGQPIVAFTERAQPFLLPLSHEDKKNKIQKVKIAEEEVEEVTGIQLHEANKKAIVEYTTSYKNINPFSKLSSIDFKTRGSHKATLRLFDDGWRVDN